MIGDMLAGFNIGAIGSTKIVGGQQVGTLDSQKWFELMDLFSDLQDDDRFFNQWAASLSEVTQAYNFAYTDRFAHVVTPLDPARVDTLEIVLLGDTHVQVPEPATRAMFLMGGVAVLTRRSLRRSLTLRGR